MMKRPVKRKDNQKESLWLSVDKSTKIHRFNEIFHIYILQVVSNCVFLHVHVLSCMYTIF